VSIFRKLKIILVAMLILMIGNFAFETILTVIESRALVSFNDLLPYTKTLFIILTIIFTQRYLKQHSKPNERKANK